MTLTVTLTDTGETLGLYRFERAEPQRADVSVGGGEQGAGSRER